MENQEFTTKTMGQLLNDFSFSNFKSQTVPNFNYKGGLSAWDNLITSLTPMQCVGMAYFQNGIKFYTYDLSEKRSVPKNTYTILYNQILKLSVNSNIQFEILDGRSIANYLKIGVLTSFGLISIVAGLMAGVDHKIDKLVPPKKEKVKGYQFTISFEDDYGKQNTVVLEVRKTKVEIIEKLYKYCSHLNIN
jgi:hypothetical protein